MCTQGIFLKFYSMMHPKEYLLQKYLSFFEKTLANVSAL